MVLIRQSCLSTCTNQMNGVGEGEMRFKSPLLWDFGSQQECPFPSRTYLLYSMMSGRQIESKGNRMVVIFPKSVEFQVRCMSDQIVVIQQFVVSIYQNCDEWICHVSFSVKL